MKMLIVNADDVGLSGAVNEAVKRCYQAGVITGVSLMACGNKFTEGAEMLRGTGNRDAGAHLTLTGGFTPCVKDTSLVSSLLAGKGVFTRDYKSFAASCLLGKINSAHLYAELKSQVERVKGEGFRITHLDSHEHVHMFPGVLKTVIALAQEMEVPYVRFPIESPVVIRERFSPKDLARHAALKLFSGAAEKALTRSGIRHNDLFWGHFHSGRIDDDILCFISENVRDGINELAVHPGILSPELLEEFPWYRNSERETEALIGGRWKGILTAGGGCLVSHAEALDLKL